VRWTSNCLISAAVASGAQGRYCIFARTHTVLHPGSPAVPGRPVHLVGDSKKEDRLVNRVGSRRIDRTVTEIRVILPSQRYRGVSFLGRAVEIIV
jgi:hypothetical protein